MNHRQNALSCHYHPKHLTLKMVNCKDNAVYACVFTVIVLYAFACIITIVVAITGFDEEGMPRTCKVFVGPHNPQIYAWFDTVCYIRNRLAEINPSRLVLTHQDGLFACTVTLYRILTTPIHLAVLVVLDSF